MFRTGPLTRSGGEMGRLVHVLRGSGQNRRMECGGLTEIMTPLLLTYQLPPWMLVPNGARAPSYIKFTILKTYRTEGGCLSSLDVTPLPYLVYLLIVVHLGDRPNYIVFEVRKQIIDCPHKTGLHQENNSCDALILSVPCLSEIKWENLVADHRTSLKVDIQSQTSIDARTVPSIDSEARKT
ncbi:hypothetical protein DY000_02040015 [Brassica cretica]|uniref:Uncharacterized protein n=1 Tax=Brassica cretica TaxID=69181 RepID=A0ABQ7B5B4_BRACR|nr:hypothetical protein DY000_02040015 [Brassica cretica]